MKANDEMVIRINPEQRRVAVESTDEQGIVCFKEIPVSSFYECIASSLKSKGVKSGLLPANCFHFSVNSNGEKSYCLRYPQLYADIVYQETEYPNFPLPRLAFGLRFTSDGRVTRCCVGVTADEAPTEDTTMYDYPFSNVAGFHLCTGSNVLPNYRKSTAIANLPGYLLRLPNNDDRFSERNNRLNMQYRELLNHLKDKEPPYYYTDILIPNGKTLKDFIEEV